MLNILIAWEDVKMLNDVAGKCSSKFHKFQSDSWREKAQHLREAEVICLKDKPPKNYLTLKAYVTLVYSCFPCKK